MLSPRINFAVAMLGSLLINIGGLWLLAHYYVPPRIFAQKSLPKPPTFEFLPPPPALPADEMVIGQHDDTGESVNETLADRVQTAKKKSEADQANQTRDPSGQRVADPDSISAPPPASPTAMQSTFAPPPTAEFMPPPSPAAAPRKFEKPKLPPAEKPNPSPAQKPVPHAPQQPAPPAPPVPPASPGSADAGTPAEHSDRDSDIYAKETSVEFKDGKVVAQNGREIKFAHPRANLAAIVDSATISFPARLTMRIRVDELGKVRNVSIVRSSGSGSLDRVFELAMYESWFEPAKDKSGRPVMGESNFTMMID